MRAEEFANLCLRVAFGSTDGLFLEPLLFKEAIHSHGLGLRVSGFRGNLS